MLTNQTFLMCLKRRGARWHRNEVHVSYDKKRDMDLSAARQGETSVSRMQACQFPPERGSRAKASECLTPSRAAGGPRLAGRWRCVVACLPLRRPLL